MDARKGQDSNLVDLFEKELLAHIQSYRQYPPQAAAERPQGVAQILFAMDRNGIILGVWVKASSGSDVLDREAVETVLRAQPLPRIPDGLPEPLNVTLPISFGSS